MINEDQFAVAVRLHFAWLEAVEISKRFHHVYDPLDLIVRHFYEGPDRTTDPRHAQHVIVNPLVAWRIVAEPCEGNELSHYATCIEFPREGPDAIFYASAVPLPVGTDVSNGIPLRASFDTLVTQFASQARNTMRALIGYAADA